MHDDCVDTLAMSSEIVKCGYVPRNPQAALDPSTITEFLERGQTEIAGVPLLAGIDISQVPTAVLMKVINQRLRQEAPPEGGPEPVFG